MTSWRDLVLLHFRSPATHLSLVADPDGLLLEEQVMAALNARGYDLLTFADPIAFRYLYETRYRDQPAPALIVRTGQADLRQLPYDLLQAGRQLSLTLHDLCPQLSYPMVRDFFRAAPDRLEAAMIAHGSDRPLSDLLRAVELFPFDVAVGASQIMQSQRLQVYQQGQEMAPQDAE